MADKDTLKAGLASWCEVFHHVTGTDWILMSLGTLGAMVTGLSLPFFYVLMGEMIDQLNVDNDDEYAQATKTLCFSFLTIGCINLTSGFLHVCCWSHVGEHLTQEFREQYVNAILSQEMGWFDVQGPGKLSTRVTDLTSKVQDGLGRKLGDLVQYTTQFVFAFIIAFYYNWKLTLVLLSAFPFIALSGVVLISAVSAVTSLSLEQYASAGSIANEALAGIRTLTALNAQPDAINRYRRHLFNAMKIGVNKGLRVGVGSGMLYGSMFLTYGLGFWYGAQLVAQAQESGCAPHLSSGAGVQIDANRSACPTGGDILTVFFCAVMGSMALGQMTPALSAVTAARSAIAMMLQIINRKPLIDGLSSQGIALPHKCRGDICLRGVKFSYPARPELLICRGYDLHIAAGETVALVGASGCGKSTIINLLLRFYDPTEGVIQLDGHSLSDLNIRSLRSQIGYVGQEPVLFAGTIGENIAHGLAGAADEDDQCDGESKECANDDGLELPPFYGSASAMKNCMYSKFAAGTTTRSMARIRERVIRAAKLSAAHEFICSLPNGYDTDVGSNGATLSGGQKQRIAIARALVKRPAVLLLDEATSALDTTSERLVQQSIDALQQLKAQTTIVIAHRLSTIRNADKICVVDDGRIVEVGTHDALLTLQGRYYELVKVQMDGASDEVQHEESLPKLDIPCDTRESFDHCHQENAHMASHIAAHVFLNAFETTPCGAIDVGDSESETATEAAVEMSNMGAMSAAEGNPAADLQVSSRVWAIIRRSPLWLFVSLLGSAVFGAIFPVWGLMLARSQDMFYQSSHEIRVSSERQALLYIALAAVAFVSSALQFYGQAQIAERLSATLRSDLFEAFLRREIGFFDRPENSTANLTTRLANEPRLVDMGFGNSVARQVQVLSTLLISLVIGFTASWQIALVVIACLPLNICSAVVQSAVASGQHTEESAVRKAKPNKDPKGPAQAVPPAVAVDPAGEPAATVPQDGAALVGGTVSPTTLISAAFLNMRTVSALSMQHLISEQYAQTTRSLSARRMRRSYKAGLGYGGSNCSLFLTYSLLFWYGSSLVKSGQISFADMMTAIFTMLLGALGIGQALMDMGDQRVGFLAAQRIFRTVDEGIGSTIDGLSEAGDKLMAPVRGRIELKDVRFSYPTRPDAQVCEDYSLVIEPGEVMALVGPSGSGKSTIINLLLRFYDPTEGVIQLDGHSLCDLNIRSLRSQIGYVGQEPVLFAGTVKDNIALGRCGSGASELLPVHETLQQLLQETRRKRILKVQEACPCGGSEVKDSPYHDIDVAHMDVEQGTCSAEDEDIVEACKHANAHGFIQSFPLGYDTDLGHGGMMVSGGQKQRIAIARALVKRPAVLLLDEATSALDATSERLVQQSIDALQQLKAQTTIVIAHRLSTIRNADKICVVDKGRIVETGNHEELLERKGLYAQLWLKQCG